MALLDIFRQNVTIGAVVVPESPRAKRPMQPAPPRTNDPPRRWGDLADRVLEGHWLSAEEGLAVLRAGDEELLDLLAAAYRVRRRWFGNRVYLNFLVNAKSGHCGEDCAYCSQSRVSQAQIARYGLLGPQQVLDGAREAARRRAGTYCIVTSGLRPGPREMDLLTTVVPEIKKTLGLRICVSPGLLGPEEAARLRACGVDRVNHNLNTSRRFYPGICTSHTYEERLGTLRAIRQAGLEICSGGIVGMGEDPADVVELALRLAELRVEATPVNFLIPIPGIALAESRESRVESREPESRLSTLDSKLSTL
jgi:biotin synthase